MLGARATLAKALKDASYKLLMGHDVYSGPEDHYFFDDFEEDFRQPYQERYDFSYFDDDTEENKEDEEKNHNDEDQYYKEKDKPSSETDQFGEVIKRAFGVNIQNPRK